MTCQKSNGKHVKETMQFLKHKDDVYSFTLVSKADSAKVTVSVDEDVASASHQAVQHSMTTVTSPRMCIYKIPSCLTHQWE